MVWWLPPRDLPAVNRLAIRSFAQAMEQASIRSRQDHRRVGDFVLDQLLSKAPPARIKTGRRTMLPTVPHGAWPGFIRWLGRQERKSGPFCATPPAASVRFWSCWISRGFCGRTPPTECEFGPVLFLRTEPEARRLDQFMQLSGPQLAVDHRLDILRQLADTTRYAHSKHVVHRSLSPQSIYVREQSDKTPTVQICNWQTSVRLMSGTTTQGTRISASLHAEQLVEDVSLAYLAPEALTGGADGGYAHDIFSLAGSSPDNINVGTTPYLDPFICERKVKRWDTGSELFAAAMTLHEMATGVLPKWGDGKTEVSLTKGEVEIVGELFPAGLRERFAQFFQRALRRNFADRYDNPGEMLAAWTSVFETIDEPARKTTSHTTHLAEGLPFELPEKITVNTQLVLLGLSTRLTNALDRLNLNTVADLLRYPLMRIYKLPGVGHKIRRELGELCKQLREGLPFAESAETEITPEGAEVLATAESVAFQVAGGKRGGRLTEEAKLIQSFLEWQASSEAPVARWPSQIDVAAELEVSRQRIGQTLARARERWSRLPIKQEC
jgi:serine/threonine protein kinase